METSLKEVEKVKSLRLNKSNILEPLLPDGNRIEKKIFHLIRIIFPIGPVELKDIDLSNGILTATVSANSEWY